MCATGCALPAQPRTYSRPGALLRIAPPVARAFRASSMWPATAPCSAPTRRKPRKSPRRWCAKPRARFTAAASSRPGWAGRSAPWALAAIAGTLFLGWQFWRHQSPRAVRIAGRQECRLDSGRGEGRRGTACGAGARSRACRRNWHRSTRCLPSQRSQHQRCGRVPPPAGTVGNRSSPTTRIPAAQAAKAGLACLDQRGSWAQVRTLNRPAILTLDRRSRAAASGRARKPR